MSGLLDKIVDRGSPIAANRTLAVVRKMFNFGVKRGILESSPCVQIDAAGEERHRDHVLTEDKIKRLWSKLDESADVGMDLRVRMMLRLQLVAARR